MLWYVLAAIPSLIVLAIVVILILASMQADDFRTERSTRIAAPPKTSALCSLSHTS